MNSFARSMSLVGLIVAALAAAPMPALADHGGVSLSMYGGSRNHGYAVDVQDRGRGYGNYGRRDERGYTQTARAPWCPTHETYHNHSYGYYGFNGGYYGVYDGNSYEEVFSRAYDDGYSDGFSEASRKQSGGTRAYRKGYDQGYRDGIRDIANRGRDYR